MCDSVGRSAKEQHSAPDTQKQDNVKQFEDLGAGLMDRGDDGAALEEEERFFTCLMKTNTGITTKQKKYKMPAALDFSLFSLYAKKK